MQNGINHNGNGHEPISKKKFLVVSWEGLSGDLAWQIKNEGNEVKINIEAEYD